MTAPLGTNCHPATAWALMGKGMSLYSVASRYRDLPRDLDEAIWAWRTARTGSAAPAGLTTMQALNLHNLARHDPLAAERFKERA